MLEEYILKLPPFIEVVTMSQINVLFYALGCPEIVLLHLEFVYPYSC